MAAPVFLITGGSRGIGEAISVAAAAKGFSVVFTYANNKARADGVLERIQKAGGQAVAVQADTAKEADILRVFEQVDARGKLGVMVYNAGVTGMNSPLAEASNRNHRQRA